VTSAFIIDVQSELKPDYEEMNNTLLEMLLNATTGNLSAGSVVAMPRWSGADPAIVQVQCILYATLCATLLASFLAMLGKQWLNRYRQSETRGSTADRSRVRERKLSGIETWKFHLAMESLPLILQCALVLLGFALSRYLREVNRSASSVVIGFTSFGFLFYLLIMTASIFSFDCPFQTPFSPLIRFAIDLAIPYWQSLRQTFGTKRQPPQPGMPGARLDSPFSMTPVGRGHALEASITTIACIPPAAIQIPWSVTPLFVQGMGGETDRLDARCISRMFVMSTDTDVITSVMDFTTEVIWHSGIKDVPLKRIYDILMECFDFSGPHPVVIPRLRGVAYLSAKAFVHIELQRRCITQHEEYKQDSWKALCSNHPLLSPTDYRPDSDLAAVLFMVDMTLGYDNRFPWERTQMTPSHQAWMSHVLLYHAWNEEQLSEAMMDFVEKSMSLEPPSDIVITNWLFIVGLMVGVPLHVNDITVRDKRLDWDSFRTPFADFSLSREMIPILRKVFRALSAILSSDSVKTPLALRALRLVTRLAVADVSVASLKLFKAIMGYDDLTGQHWEAARLAIHGAFQVRAEVTPSVLGELKEILKFLNHHLDLHGAGEDHGPSISLAIDAIILRSDRYRDNPLAVECTGNFDRTSPSFVRGMRLMMHPDCSFMLRRRVTGLIALTCGQWFSSPTPVMDPEDMAEFCEHLAVFIIDAALHVSSIQRWGVTILFGMLRSPEWREHIATRFWCMLAYCTVVEEGQESFRWCLQNAIELLEFARGLPDGEGLKWWYGTLWFHYDKLDAATRDDVDRIARDMSLGDNLSDLNLYLNLIGEEIARARQDVDRFFDVVRVSSFGMERRARLIALEGNYHRLARVAGQNR